MAQPPQDSPDRTVAPIPDATSMRTVAMVQDERLFGRYRPIRRLGVGGMGVVMLARDEVLDINVAIKLLPDEVVYSPADIQQLKNEVLNGMALTHPGIVRVFSFEQAPDRAAIVMEYVDGETLADLLPTQPGNCFDLEQIRPWLEQLCTALEYIHKDGQMAHRDVKPRNLLLSTGGRLKLADLGISSSIAETMLRLSTRQATAGTPPYMSPQQVLGEPPSQLDDIYSLGATIYDLLTGKPPFFRGQILAQVRHEMPPPMAIRRTELGVTGKAPIPLACELAVAACLAKDPHKRPATASEFLRALNSIPPQSATLPSVEPDTHEYRYVPLVDPKTEHSSATGTTVAQTQRVHTTWPTHKTQPAALDETTVHRSPTTPGVRSPKTREHSPANVLGAAGTAILCGAVAAGIFFAVRHHQAPPPPPAPATPVAVAKPTQAVDPLRGARLDPAKALDLQAPDAQPGKHATKRPAGR